MSASTVVPLPLPDSPAVEPDTTLWTVVDVAAFLKVSTSWVRHRAAINKLPHHRVGGWMIRFDPAEVRAWATKRRS